MKPTTTWLLDHEAHTQICATRRWLLEHLGAAPDDVKALWIAEAIADVDPEHDPQLREHARRAGAARAQLGNAWIEHARAAGVDVLLFNLCAGMRRANIGEAARPALARHAAAITADPRILALLRDDVDALGARSVRAEIDATIAQRAPALAAGRIEAAFVPPALRDGRQVAVRFHRSGHLAWVRVDAGRTRNGTLTLDARPGTGHLHYTARRGGYGYAVDDRYRDGAVHATYFSPWHDGVEATEPMAFTRWVAEALASLEELAVPAPPPPKRPARKKPAKSRRRR